MLIKKKTCLKTKVLGYHACKFFTENVPFFQTRIDRAVAASGRGVLPETRRVAYIPVGAITIRPILYISFDILFWRVICQWSRKILSA